MGPRSGLRLRATASKRRPSIDAASHQITDSAAFIGSQQQAQPPDQSHPAFRSDPHGHPGQVTISVFLIVFLFLLSTCRQSGDDDAGAIRAAALAVFVSFLTASYLQTRDLVLSFPSSGFWRVVYGACAFYALFLVAVAQMDKVMARSTVATLFPDIGELEDFEMGLYANKEAVMGTCRLSKLALVRQFFHCPWVLAHSVGWTMKMLVFRDFPMAFVASIVFELTEVTLMHMVPEFEECWWDSLFLDTLGANLLGMALGYQINKWIGRRRTPATGEENKAAQLDLDLGAELDWMGKYAPIRKNEALSSSGRPNWLVFQSLSRLLKVLGMALFMSLSDLNAFLLINSLGIANNMSWFVLLRLVVITLIWVPAAAEFYVDCDGTNLVFNDCKLLAVRLVCEDVV